MTSANTTLPMPSDEPLALAQTYQQSMQGLNAIVIARPPENGIVMLRAGQMTRVSVQAGQHYKLRKTSSDGTQQTPDNVVAVRHGDALHVRYADGSVANFDNFYTVCTSSSVCSVNLANDSVSGITLSAADPSGGPVADDGLLVYAHGNHDVLMAMAQDQPGLESAIRGLGDAPVLTYVPPDSNPGIIAVLALGAVGAAGAAGAAHSGAAGSVLALGGESLALAATQSLEKISTAAQNNTAASSHLAVTDYVAANVTGVTDGNLGAINSALDSTFVTGAKADTAPEVQAIVDAYAAIQASADGTPNNSKNGPTAQQYALIGVTGVTGTPAADNGIFLLNNVVDAKPFSGVDTVPEVQALADAANRVISGAAGGAAPTQSDLAVLGITGVSTANLAAVQAAIAATNDNGAEVNTLGKLQVLVDTVNGTGATNALNQIRDAAQNNTAVSSGLAASVFTAAGVSGVTAANQGSIDSALDSAAVTGAQADTAAEVQAIVNAYNAILSSADGTPDNTISALTGAQYNLVGVTGVSGISAPGNALHLLDSVVDASPMSAVDTEPELQAMADAANHVITGSAGGTAPTLVDLTALGITGVNASNLAAVQAAIAATPDDGTGVDTRGELQAVVTAAVSAGQIPHLSSALAGVTNLDVTSDLVLSADTSLTVGTGLIHITDLGGPGYQGDTSNNTQTIDVATAVANHLLTITGTGSNTHIVINPMWDLDLASNYRISIDDGAFLNGSGTQAASHIADINFSTVTPGNHAAGTAASEAAASQVMVDATGTLAAGKSWLNIQGIGNNTGGVTQLGDLSGGSYALVMKNYATTRGGDPLLGGDGSDGIAAHDTNIGVINFGNNDIVYFDSQVNNSAIQFFDPRYTTMTDGGSRGGLSGQNALVMGLVSTPAQQGSTAMIMLGLEGNTSNQIYPSIVTLDSNTIGWANVWHSNSPAVIMG